jgi:Flp pilus assembly protein TadG
VRDCDGAELVEAALVIPLLFTLLLGIVWVGRGFNIYATITHAAREGARVAVLPNCATCGSSYPTDADVRSVVDEALVASALQPESVSDFSITRNVTLDAGGAVPDRGVRISFRYPVSLSIPFLPEANFSIATAVQMRQEQQ